MSRDLVFEIGTEEIPSAPLYQATEQLGTLAETAFAEAHLAHGAIATMSTPRRMILTVADVADATDPLSERFRGPAASIAFKDGEPTRAVMGFARGKGVAVEDLVVEDEGGKEYVYAVVEHPAKPTAKVLPDLLSSLPPALHWPKSQRWGRGCEHFSRPVRWLLALWGKEVMPATFAGLTAGRVTRGHRLLCNREIEVLDATAFYRELTTAFVIPSAPARAAAIRDGIARAETSTGLRADTPASAFDEVVNLVEYPTVLVGHFDERFLEVPTEIITEAMLKHQRYFPMYHADRTLSNSFIITSNGKPSATEGIIEGNERVVRARLDDAEFFYREDLRHPLTFYVEGLRRVVFQERLGSVYDKTQRIRAVVHAIVEGEELDTLDAVAAERAALLCKADLVTSAVIEFPSQQGVMGGYYARAQGEDARVTEAIADHYRPRFAGDDLPRGDAGKVVALADKLDTICGIFAIGEGPTGSSDPYALRRSAIGIVNILRSGLTVSLSAAVEASFVSYGDMLGFDHAAVREQVVAFLRTRLGVIVREAGIEPDVASAVMATGSVEPADVFARATALQRARQDDPELFSDLSTAYARAANLADPALGSQIDPASLTAEEHALYQALRSTQDALLDARDDRGLPDYPAMLALLSSLRAPIDVFFDDVLVMDDDRAVRERHLRLLNRFVAAFDGVATLDQLEG